MIPFLVGAAATTVMGETLSPFSNNITYERPAPITAVDWQRGPVFFLNLAFFAQIVELEGSDIDPNTEFTQHNYYVGF